MIPVSLEHYYRIFLIFPQDESMKKIKIHEKQKAKNCKFHSGKISYFFVSKKLLISPKFIGFF